MAGLAGFTLALIIPAVRRAFGVFFIAPVFLDIPAI